MRPQARSLLLSVVRQAERTTVSQKLCSAGFQPTLQRLHDVSNSAEVPLPSAPKVSGIPHVDRRSESTRSLQRHWMLATQLQPSSFVHSSAPLGEEDWRSWVSDAAAAASSKSGKKKESSKSSQSKQQQQQQQQKATEQKANQQKQQQQAKQPDQKGSTEGSKSDAKTASGSKSSSTRQPQDAQAAAAGTAADDLEKLEAILGFSDDDFEEPLTKQPAVPKRPRLKTRTEGDRAEPEEEWEEEEDWDEEVVGMSAQQEIDALGRSGKVSREAMQQIRVYDLDAEGEWEGESFRTRDDRIYYPGQMYTTEELDFTQPLPEESLTLMRRQDRQVNSKEVLKAADFRNVRVLSRFISPTARILPRHKTKLSAKAQRKVSREIRISRALGLMPFTLVGQPSFRFKRDFEESSDDLELLKDPVDLQ